MDIIPFNQEQKNKQLIEIEKKIYELIKDIIAIDAIALLENLKLTIHAKTLRKKEAQMKKSLVKTLFFK